MATYDFRVLLETVGGHKTSYFSSSFVNTDNNLVLSASQVWQRITGSVSCSYHNSPEFAPSLWSHPDTGSINTFFTFKDNTILSASLTGSLDTGVIEFTALDTEYDRLLRYKFFGDKICNTLGLPNNQWIYVDQMRLPADDESNYFQGNINAKNIYISDNISFANNSNLNTDLPIFINTGSDRHIKFIDERGTGHTALFMGYDKDTDKYEIGSDITKGIVLKGITEISSSQHDLGGSQNVIEIATANVEVRGKGGINYILRDFDDPTKFLHIELQSDGDCQIKNSSEDRDLEIRTDDFNDAIYIKDLTERVGIGENTPASKLHIAGDLITDSHITASGDISASAGIVLGGERRTTWPASSAGQWYDGTTYQSSSIDVFVDGHITASGDISSSGDITLANNLNIEGPAGGTRYRLINVTNTINAGSGRKIPFLIATGSTVDSQVVNISASAGNAFVGIGTAYTDRMNHTLTVAGDISASGNGYFGEVVNLTGEDPRLKLKAVGANHPGIEWYEDSSRKWVLFSDPDSSQGGNDNLTWKNASDTELMELDQDGMLYVGSKIIHLDDADTYINFTDDDINIQAGGVNMMDFTQNDASQDEITFNEAGADLDVRIEGDVDTDLFFTNAGTDRVGVGTNSPSSKLQVDGDITATHITASGNISASGTIFGKQYHFTHHNWNGTAERMFLPLNTTSDDSSIPTHTAGYQRRMIVPFDGSLEKIIMRGENATGNTSGSMWKAGDAAAMSEASVSDTVNMSAANTTYTLTFSSGNTFSAGEVISIAIHPTNDIDDAQATAVWLYTVNG